MLWRVVQAHLAVLGQVEQDPILQMFHVMGVLVAVVAHGVRLAQLEES
jgi:hypothetical protein